MELSPELRDLLALHLVPGLGPRLTAALLERFGSPRAIFQVRSDELQAIPHIGEKLAQQLRRAFERINVDGELELMDRHGVSLLPLGSANYPAALAKVPVPPTLLYLRGSLQESDTNAVAIVGSRHCTSYGRRIAERLAGDLSRAGFTIVSGLALATSL